MITPEEVLDGFLVAPYASEGRIVQSHRSLVRIKRNRTALTPKRLASKLRTQIVKADTQVIRAHIQKYIFLSLRAVSAVPEGSHTNPSDANAICKTKRKATTTCLASRVGGTLETAPRPR